MTDDYIIYENLKSINYNIEEAKVKYRKSDDIIELMAVTKTVNADKVNIAISHGIKLLGENRVQEYLEKKEHYDKSADVHFIGHLQTNKVKYIIKDISMIHSVDSLKLANEINRLSLQINKITDVLIEINIGMEESKSGVTPIQLDELFHEISELKNIQIRGFMAIPPIYETEKYFDKMNELFSVYKSKMTTPILSMGMSGDYALAIKHGSNLVRIGSGLFGARTYY